MLSPQPPAVGEEWFAAQLIRGNHENTVRFRVADVNNFQVSTARRLADRYAGALSPWTIFSRIRQDLLDLFLFDTVVKDVRLTRCGIEVEADMHRHQYREERVFSASSSANLSTHGKPGQAAFMPWVRDHGER
jgi:hypothetical protein